MFAVFIAVFGSMIVSSVNSKITYLNQDYNRIILFKDMKHVLKVEHKKITSCESSNPKVANVSDSGVVTSVSAGRVKVICKTNDDMVYSCIVDVSPVDPTKKMIALTFDDGPGYNDASNRICDTLEKYDMRATFFTIGKNARDNPDNMKRKVALGCQIGCHTMNHKHYGKNVTDDDIVKACDAIEKACGVRPTAFRAPGGITNKKIKKCCIMENMPIYYWTYDSQDWQSKDPEKICKRMKSISYDGNIILLHDLYTATANAFEQFAPVLVEQGYQFVTCEELVLAKSGKQPKAGVEYFNGKIIKCF